jgi:mannose-6-phosphate isomerase-like protein (cupin superfamily)
MAMDDGTEMPRPPGTVGVSHLYVYESVAPDGMVGGTPHAHLTCTEGYVVLAGSGAVQTLGGHGYREIPLAVGAFVWFSPGTIHRLINRGGLRLLVLMQNGGLPEAGDAVLTFPAQVLADPVAYAKTSTLPGGGSPSGDLTAAYRRRDLAVRGFLELRAGGPAALRDFYQAAARLVAPRLAEWRARWEGGALRTALETGRQLDALAAGVTDYLVAGGVRALPAPSEQLRLGMCGLLDTYRVQADCVP